MADGGTHIALAPAEPGIDWAFLEDDLAQRCPWCREKLHPLIETLHGLVYVCTNDEHGGAKVFWGGEYGTERYLEWGQWIIEALIDERGIPRKARV